MQKRIRGVWLPMHVMSSRTNKSQKTLLDAAGFRVPCGSRDKDQNSNIVRANFRLLEAWTEER